ncbi:MAG: DUF3014 domain-containing protein [Gammaproteobacteria bacterium]|nr:DUF3014 domain-containing protein [Gammaproteobacteria bacterium]
MKKFVPAILVIVLIGACAGLYYYWIHGEQRAAPPPALPAAAPAPAPAPPIRYPIKTAEPEQAKPLPPLMESDAAVQETLAGFVDKNSLARFVYLDSIVRRFVVTIDNLTHESVPQRYYLAKPAEGKFVVSGKRDSGITLSPENYRRYSAYIQLAESVDTKKLIAAYVYFYPLFQEEYKNLGDPKRYFNDRVVEVIDDLLAAPDVKQPVKLVQPKVFYEFADPKLEGLSAGKKIMLRMGSDNAARVKAKLQEIRREITSLSR